MKPRTPEELSAARSSPAVQASITIKLKGMGFTEKQASEILKSYANLEKWAEQEVRRAITRTMF